MAAAILRRALEERRVTGVEVESAGTGAWDGAPASEGAYLVALEHGLDLSAHRARLLTRDLVRGADLVLAMSPQHRARAEALGAGDRAVTLPEYAGEAGGEVPDPYGSELDEYRAAFDRLQALIEAVADRLAARR
jgi:protein-tyrosine-phosphatase